MPWTNITDQILGQSACSEEGENDLILTVLEHLVQIQSLCLYSLSVEYYWAYKTPQQKYGVFWSSLAEGWVWHNKVYMREIYNLFSSVCGLSGTGNYGTYFCSLVPFLSQCRNFTLLMSDLTLLKECFRTRNSHINMSLHSSNRKQSTIYLLYLQNTG